MTHSLRHCEADEVSRSNPIEKIELPLFVEKMRDSAGGMI